VCLLSVALSDCLSTGGGFRRHVAVFRGTIRSCGWFRLPACRLVALTAVSNVSHGALERVAHSKPSFPTTACREPPLPRFPHLARVLHRSNSTTPRRTTVLTQSTAARSTQSRLWLLTVQPRGCHK